MSLHRLKDKIRGPKADAGPVDRPLIVIVDDNNDVLLSLRTLLRSRYAVVTCNSAAKAVEVIRLQRPRAVILDIKMPDHDGFWTFSEIRKFDPDVPVIINSGFQDEVDEDTLYGGYRPFAYMTKGNDVGVLLGTIERAVAASRG